MAQGLDKEFDLPLVSVVIPAYNAEQYVDGCLDSVRNQTYSNLEIIFVDDGSTDDTHKKANEHADEDERIRIIKQTNQFAGVARNNGMSLAKGKYLYFFDVDDTLEPCALEKAVERAECTESDIVLFRSKAFDNKTGNEYNLDYALRCVDYDSVLSGNDIGSILFQFCVGWPWDKLYRSSFVLEHGLRFQALRTTNDAYFVFLSLAIAEKIAFVDYVGVRHRTNNESSLEGSRRKSYQNAVTAIRAIGDGLVREGCFDVCKNSFFNWVFDFSVWNYTTLDKDSGIGFLRAFDELASWLISMECTEVFLSENRYKSLFRVMGKGHYELMGLAFEFALHDESATMRLSESERALQSKCDEITRLEDELVHLSQVVDDLTDEKERLQSEIDAILHSKRYKVGTAISKPYRAIADLLRKS